MIHNSCSKALTIHPTISTIMTPECNFSVGFRVKCQKTNCLSVDIFTVCSQVRIGCSDFSDHSGCADTLGSWSPVHRCRSCYRLSNIRRALFLPHETNPVTQQDTWQLVTSSLMMPITIWTTMSATCSQLWSIVGDLQLSPFSAVNIQFLNNTYRELQTDIHEYEWIYNQLLKKVYTTSK